MLRRQSSNPATVHWSKDFVEHLRTVHFTLVAVAVGLILILSRPSSPALMQIRQIVALKKEWPPRRIAELHSKFDVDSSKQFKYIDWKNQRQIAAWVYWKDGHKRDAVRFALPEQDWIDASGSLSEFPSTLAAFRNWWNGLETVAKIYIPGAVYDGGVYVTDHGSPVAAVHLADSSEFSSDLPVAKSQPRVMKLEIVFGGHQDTYVFFADDGKFEYELPIEMVTVDVDQDLLSAGVKNWKRGPFEKAFGALAQQASGLEAEDLEDVEKIVAEHVANRSEEFEAFGMKFPMAQVTVWGTVILLGVQLYFYLYLKQLSGKLGPDDPGWDIPWISMDQSFLAQAIFFTTVLVLPAIAMILLGGRGSLQLTAGYTADSWHGAVKFKDWELAVRLGIAAYLLAGIGTLTLGIATWTCRPRLGPKKEHCPVQLFE